jgi:hypothetical protein
MDSSTKFNITSSPFRTLGIVFNFSASNLRLLELGDTKRDLHKYLFKHFLSNILLGFQRTVT